MKWLLSALFFLSFSALSGCSDVIPEVGLMRFIPSKVDPNKDAIPPGAIAPEVESGIEGSEQVSSAGYKLKLNVSKQSKNEVLVSQDGYQLITSPHSF